MLARSQPSTSSITRKNTPSFCARSITGTMLPWFRLITMWASSTSMLRNCGLLEKAGRIRFRTTVRANPSSPTWVARNTSAIPPSAIFLVIA
jgi:hypothetical protein